jgi:isoleucyl-tRNA synthetase
MLAKLAETEELVRSAYAEARYNEAARALEDLIITQASQDYIRLVRSELWRDDPKERKRRLAIYAVLGHVLSRCDGLLHPVAPFVTEYLHQEVFAGNRRWKDPLVTHVLGAERSGVEYGPAEKIVELALMVEEAANSARTRAKLKRRWPLAKLLVLAPRSAQQAAASPLIAQLCNVKEVRFVRRADSFPANFEIVPNRSRIGVQFKGDTGAVLAALPTMKGQSAILAWRKGKPVKTMMGGNTIDVPLALFDLVTKPADGFEVGEKQGLFVAISVMRDDKLVAEGLGRDVARRLQALRKARGYSPTAILARASVAGLEEEELKMLEPLREELAFLVRVRKVSLLAEKQGKVRWAEEDLDGRTVYLDVS